MTDIMQELGVAGDDWHHLTAPGAKVNAVKVTEALSDYEVILHPHQTPYSYKIRRYLEHSNSQHTIYNFMWAISGIPQADVLYSPIEAELFRLTKAVCRD